MTKTWLDKLIDPLLNPQYPKTTYKLAIYNDEGEIIAKCAEGEISCQNNLGVNLRTHAALPFDALEKLGIPKDLIYHDELPSWISEEDNLYIGNYLHGLNDIGLTYPEIAEFLRTTLEDAV